MQVLLVLLLRLLYIEYFSEKILYFIIFLIKNIDLN